MDGPSQQSMTDRVRCWFSARRNRRTPLINRHAVYTCPIIPQSFSSFHPNVEVNRALGYDQSFQERLLSHFVQVTPPCLVYVMPDDQLLEIHRAWFDSWGVPPSVPCLSWWSVVEQIRIALHNIDGQIVTFGDMREYLGMRLYPYMDQAGSAEEWQRWMVALDHLCQIIILVCCEPVETPRSPSFLRGLTSRH